MFDEPQTSIYGGEVSAPVFKNMARRYSSLPRKSMLAAAGSEERSSESRFNIASREGAQIMTLAAVRPLGREDFPYDEVDRIILPDFRGKTIRDAMRLARSLGLDYSIAGSGVVISQSPSPGVALSGAGTLELIGGLR
jgi:cell division protein FtsI (penicillin-binding protein 3)